MKLSRARLDLLALIAVLAVAALYARPHPQPNPPSPPTSAPSGSAAPARTTHLRAGDLRLDHIGLGMSRDEVLKIKGKPLQQDLRTLIYPIRYGSETWNELIHFRGDRVCDMSAAADLEVNSAGKCIKAGESSQKVKELLGPPDRVEPNTIARTPPPNELWYYDRLPLLVRINNGRTQCIDIGNDHLEEPYRDRTLIPKS